MEGDIYYINLVIYKYNMENASKALFIATGVLIAVLILSLFSFVFLRMSEYSARIYEMIEMSKYTKFNQKFLEYENKGELSIQDVVSIINLAKDNNKNNRFPTTIRVMKNSQNLADITNANDLLSNPNWNTKRYSCTVIIDSDSRLVESVTIIEI